MFPRRAGARDRSTRAGAPRAPGCGAPARRAGGASAPQRL